MTISLSETKKIEFLKDEYLLLQNQYEDYDKRSLQIKGWVSSGAIAGLALGFSTSEDLAYVIPIITAIIVVITWYLEAYWKIFQYALSDRIRSIEAFFRNDQDILQKEIAPFQIYNSWFSSYTKDNPIYPYEQTKRPVKFHKRLKNAAFQRFVLLPYFPIILLCIASAAILVC